MQNSLQISTEETEQERTFRNSEPGTMWNNDKGIISKSTSSFYSRIFFFNYSFSQYLPSKILSMVWASDCCGFHILPFSKEEFLLWVPRLVPTIAYCIACVCVNVGVCVYRFLEDKIPQPNLNNQFAHYCKTLVFEMDTLTGWERLLRQHQLASV